MDREVGRTVLRLDCVTHLKPKRLFTRVEPATNEGARLDRLAPQPLVDADGPQDPRDVGTEIDTGANPRERRRLFKDCDVECRLLHQCCGSQPSETPSNNCNSRFRSVIHMSSELSCSGIKQRRGC